MASEFPCPILPLHEVPHGKEEKGNTYNKRRPPFLFVVKTADVRNDRPEQNDVRYEQITIASPYLLPDEVVPHFKASFPVYKLWRASKSVDPPAVNDSYCSDDFPLGTCETVFFWVESERSALNSGKSSCRSRTFMALLRRAAFASASAVRSKTESSVVRFFVSRQSPNLL